MQGWFFRTMAGVQLLAGLAGCRHAPAPSAPGSSAYRFVQAPPAAPSTGRPDAAPEPIQRFDYREAQLVDPVIMPAYPARALAAKAGAATVGVHIAVDEHGMVTDIRASIWVVSLPGPFSGDFRAAVDAAVRQWRFVPAETIEFATGEQDGRPTTRVRKREKVATEFDLAFDFAPGGGVVQARQPPQ